MMRVGMERLKRILMIILNAGEAASGKFIKSRRVGRRE